VPDSVNAGEWNRLLWDIFTGSSDELGGGASGDYDDVDYITFHSDPPYILDDFDWQEDQTQTDDDDDSCEIRFFDYQPPYTYGFCFQTFQTGAGITNIPKVQIKAKKVGSPPYNLRVELYVWDTDYATTIKTRYGAYYEIDKDDVTTDYQVFDVPLGVSLSASTTYMLKICMAGAATVGAHYHVAIQTGSDEYADGDYWSATIPSNIQQHVGEDIWFKTFYSKGETDGSTLDGAWRRQLHLTNVETNTSEALADYCGELTFDFEAPITIDRGDLVRAATGTYNYYTWNVVAGAGAGDATAVSQDYSSSNQSGYTAIKCDWVNSSGYAAYITYTDEDSDLRDYEDCNLSLWAKINSTGNLSNYTDSGRDVCVRFKFVNTGASGGYENYHGVNKESLNSNWNRIVFDSSSPYSTTGKIGDIDYIHVLVGENANDSIYFDEIRVDRTPSVAKLRFVGLSNLDLSSYNKFKIEVKSSDAGYIGRIQLVLDDGTNRQAVELDGVLTNEWSVFEVDLNHFDAVDTSTLDDIGFLFHENENKLGGSGTIYIGKPKFVNNLDYYIDGVFFSNEVEEEGSSSISFDLLDEGGNYVEKGAGVSGSDYDLEVGRNVIASDYRIDSGDDINVVEVVGASPEIVARMRNQENIERTKEERKKTFNLPYIRSIFGAFFVARRLLDAKNKVGVSCKLDTIGVPELRVGELTRLTGLWKQLTDKHLITNIKRKLDENGYRISIDLGNERKKLIKLLKGELE